MDCRFPGDNRAKCQAIEGFGRALHGAQDFYSHSNWTDVADPNKPISLNMILRPAATTRFRLADVGTE
jgi:hypothetical protein